MLRFSLNFGAGFVAGIYFLAGSYYVQTPICIYPRTILHMTKDATYMKTEIETKFFQEHIFDLDKKQLIHDAESHARKITSDGHNLVCREVTGTIYERYWHKLCNKKPLYCFKMAFCDDKQPDGTHCKSISLNMDNN